MYWVNILNEGLIFAIWTASLAVLMGTAGLLAIAPCGIGGVGGFVTAYLAVNHHWSFLSVILLGLAIGLLVGCLLGIPALRLGRDHVILLTLAFSVVVASIIPLISAFNASVGLQGVPFINFFGKLESPTQLLRLLIPITLVCYLFCWRISASPFGRGLRGIREDEIATQALGKNVVRMKVITFAATSALASLGGVLIVYYDQVATLGQFTFDVTTVVVAGLIIGGTGSLSGAFVGAMLVAFIEPLLQRIVSIQPEQASLWQLVIFGALLVIIIRFRPEGLIPEGSWPALGRSLARLRSGTAGGADTPGVGAPDGAASDLAVSADSGLATDLAHNVTVHPDTAHAHPADGGHVRAAQPGGAMPGTTVLVAKDLAKSFGGIHAVNGLDLELVTGK